MRKVNDAAELVETWQHRCPNVLNAWPQLIFSTPSLPTNATLPWFVQFTESRDPTGWQASSTTVYPAPRRCLNSTESSCQVSVSKTKSIDWLLRTRTTASILLFTDLMFPVEVTIGYFGIANTWRCMGSNKLFSLFVDSLSTAMQSLVIKLVIVVLRMFNVFLLCWSYNTTK